MCVLCCVTCFVVVQVCVCVCVRTESNRLEGIMNNAAFIHQEFQVPEMEVLNLIRLFWGGFSLI